MATEKRLIDANALLLSIRTTLVRSKQKYAKNPIISDILDSFDELVIGKVKKAPTVDAVEVVHSRFVRIADFGDGEGCFGYCEKCGTVHHAQSPVALKADHRWCRWCGAKMDVDWNG